MSGMWIAAIVAICVWGIVQLAKARSGIITDERGNETYIGDADENAPSRAEIEQTQAEIEQLRERLHVLERIATDSNSTDARERARIAAEIEALRAPNSEQQKEEPLPTPSLTQEDKSK